MSIARAIMKDAPIIILDEETANVDPENEKELMEAVAELTHDKTVIRSISARSPQRLAPTKAGIASQAARASTIKVITLINERL